MKRFAGVILHNSHFTKEETAAQGQGIKVAPSGFRPSPSEAPHPALEYASSLLIGCQA